MTWLNDWLMEHVDFYRYALKQADYRTKDWFLLWADPIPTLFLTFIYLLIIYFGPKYMKNRPEVHVPAMVLFLYNMALVVLSGYMVTEVKKFTDEMGLVVEKNLLFFRFFWVFIVVDII